MSNELTVTASGSDVWTGSAGLHTDSLFFSNPWLSAVAEAFRAHEYCVIAWTDGEPVAVCPGMVISRGPFRVLYSSIPFGGVSGSPEGVRMLLEGFQELAAGDGIHRIRVQPLPDHPVDCPDYTLHPVLYPVLDLTEFSGGQVLESLGSRQRRDVRKGQRDGVTVRKADSIEDLRDFYRLYLQSQNRNRAPARYHAGYFERIFASRELSPFVTVYLACMDGESIAGMMTARSGSTTHYLHGGFDYRLRSHCANDLLVFHVIRDAITLGSEKLDFGGTSPDDRALLHFKTKWGTDVSNTPVLGRDLSRIRCIFMDAAMKLLGMPLIRGMFNSGRRRA